MSGVSPTSLQLGNTQLEKSIYPPQRFLLLLLLLSCFHVSGLERVPGPFLRLWDSREPDSEPRAENMEHCRTFLGEAYLPKLLQELINNSFRRSQRTQNI
ncbi:hypothetical protein ILYODFUR_026747 [Ilyodon furcidens]|uniref:Uncharacterized protein n=1 Tax=Ilyodon furcidens TaxID=33524 RepID=A0ABV0U8R1_9TELE